MTKITLKLNKDINSNAEIYFSKAKKLKNKIPGLKKALEKTKEEISNHENKQKEIQEKQKQQKILKEHIKQEWYEKFRYTITPSNLLFVIGKDSSTNEILIKKHMQENDLVFHTEEQGSPFGLLKNGKDQATKEEIYSCAQFLACFSRQWSKGYGQADVFWVYPEQVTKKALSGEYIAKGAFQIYGEKNIIKNIPLKISLGIIKKEIQTEDSQETLTYHQAFSGPKEFVLNKTKLSINLEPGQNTYKKLNKEITTRLKTKIDELPKYIPNNCKIMKR